MAESQRFRKHERLLLRGDFARVFARKCSASNDLLVVYVAKNDLPWSRMGLSVSKRVGNAVRRNYVRRRIREAFRTCKAHLPKGLDIVCMARPEAADPSRSLDASLRMLVDKAARRCLKPSI